MSRSNTLLNVQHKFTWSHNYDKNNRLTLRSHSRLPIFEVSTGWSTLFVFIDSSSIEKQSIIDN